MKIDRLVAFVCGVIWFMLGVANGRDPFVTAGLVMIAVSIIFKNK